MPTHFKPTDLRSVSRLAVDATLGVVGIAEHLHRNIQGVAAPLGKASDEPARGIAGFVYKAIRGTTRVVGSALELALAPVEALLRNDSAAGAAGSGQREAIVAALNGVLGDHLAATGNPLAISMTLRHDGQALEIDRAHLKKALPRASKRVLLLLHGLCMHPGQWAREGVDPGVGLAQAHGSTLLHLHYNTGRPIGENGRELALLLESLVAEWPVKLEEIAIIGHSMGGLVARSACHQANAHEARWPKLLSKMIFLGTPHHGSPLERGGRIVDVVLGSSPYTTAFARIGALRSAGITDLRHGNILQDDAPDGKHTHVPLPDGVACHAIAGVLATQEQKAKGKLLGDGLVTVDSALGKHKLAARSLAFDETRQWIAQGVGHLGLLNEPAVIAQVKQWLVPGAKRA